MHTLLVQSFLFLWLRAHLLWPVGHAAARVEVVCGDLSTIKTATQIDSDVIGGDLDISVRHPAMIGDTVDLVEGIQYEVTFDSRDDVMEVQGVALLTYTEEQMASSVDPAQELSSWSSPYRCQLHSFHPFPPSPVQLTTTPVDDQASKSWTYSSSDTEPELLTSEPDITSTSSFSSSSSSSSSSEELASSSSSSEPPSSSLYTSLSSSSSSLYALSDVLSSSSLSSVPAMSALLSSARSSSSSVSTPALVTSLPRERFSEHLPFSLRWTAGTLTSPCLTLMFVIMVNSTAWIHKSQELCQPQGCRHYFTSHTGILTSPGYPSQYPDSSDCTYVIYTNTSSSIEIQFQMFHLEQSYSERCVDSVTVSHLHSAVNVVLCGDYDVRQLRHLRYVSHDDTMVLHFVSDNKFSSSGFRAVYATTDSKDCDVVHRHLNGTIQSPTLSSSGTYLPNMQCNHSIHLPPSYRIRFYLRFLNFSDLLTASCTLGDFLQFRDLDSYNQATVTCHSDVTADALIFESSGSRVEMVFVSDHVHEGRGFEVFYVGVPSCHNETYHETFGSVSSVNFPGNYPNMQECFYTLNLTGQLRQYNNITERSHDVIEVTFQKFFTESDSGGDRRLRDGLCLRDFVAIYAGGERHRVCGDWAGKEHLLYFRFRSDFVVFRFVTDEQETRLGFNATWRLLKDDAAILCLSSLLSTEHFTFQVLYRQETWWDGQTDCESRGGLLASVLNATMQRLLTQHLLSQRCQTSGRAFWIGANDRQWESDFYWADHSKVTYANWFPGFVHAGLTEARYGRQPSDDGQGDEDCVELRRHFALPDKGHTATPVFYWNDRNCGRRNPYVCQIQPQAIGPQRVECDRNLTLSPWVSEVRLRSPGYPHDSYPDHTRCTLFLHAPADAILEIDFWDFQLENGSVPGRCDYDFLEITTSLEPTDVSDADHRRCGDWSRKVKLLRQVVPSFYAFLRFTADHSKHFRGFDLTVRMISGRQHCSAESWIPVQRGCIRVIPELMDLQTAQNYCSSAFATPTWRPSSNLEVLSMFSRLLALQENADLPVTSVHVFVSNSEGASCQNLSVAAIDVIDNVTVVTKVSTTLVSCDTVGRHACFSPAENQTTPQHIFLDAVTEREGYLQPPLSSDNNDTSTEGNKDDAVVVTGERNYTNNAAVTWTLQSAGDQRLLLLLSRLDVEYQQECLYDRIWMRNTTLSAPLCGLMDRGRAALSWGSWAEVSFQSDYSVTGRAFTLTWQSLNMSQCRNTVFREGSATFSSFNYPRPFPDRLICLITISVEEGRRVLLEFSSIRFRDASRDSVAVDLGGGEEEEEGEEEKEDGQLMLGVGDEDGGEGGVRRVFVSHGAVLTIRLDREEMLEEEGFQASYRTVPDPYSLSLARTDLKPNSSTIFLSPNYPHSLPEGIAFNYTLSAPIGYQIHVTFHHFRLPRSESCGNVLEIYDVSIVSENPHLLIRLCGGEYGNDTVSVLNRIKIVVRAEQNTREERRKRSADLNEGVDGFNISFLASPDEDYLQKTSVFRAGRFYNCTDHPCLHNGTCVQEAASAFCLCPLHYTGLFCQTTWCEASLCGPGACQLTDALPGYRCLCPVGFFGAQCQMNTSRCRRHICYGSGDCVDYNSSVECVCDQDKPEKTGPYCNVTNPDHNMPETVGQRLLREPIWIGLIVILSVLVFFGIMCLVRRRCAKRYACCQLQFKRKDPGDGGSRQARGRGADAGAHPLTTFHFRRQPLKPPSSAVTTPSIVRATPAVSVAKVEEEASPAASGKTPTIKDLKAEVAARFFASYREAERAPISTPLPTDFSKTTDTFLAQTSEENTVGAIVGGTLLHDLQQHKSREERRSRSSLFPGPPRRRSSSVSSYSNRERIRRCHSTGGPYSTRQELISAREGSTANLAHKSLSVDDRDTHSLCSDRDPVSLPSPAELRSLSTSPTKPHTLAEKGDAEDVKACATRGSSEKGGPQHLFPEVIVHSVHSQHVDRSPSDGPHSAPVDRVTKLALPKVSASGLTRVKGDNSAFGRPNPNPAEKTLGNNKDVFVMTESSVPVSHLGKSLRYKNDRLSGAEALATRQSLDEHQLPSTTRDSRERKAKDRFDQLSARILEQPSRQEDGRWLIHQNTLDSYLRHKSRSHRSSSYGNNYLRRDHPPGLVRRSCTSPVLFDEREDDYKNGQYYLREKRHLKAEHKQKVDAAYGRKKHSSGDHRQRYDNDQDQKGRHGDSSKYLPKHIDRLQSARDRRATFKRNETMSAGLSWQSQRCRSKRRSADRLMRKYSSMDILGSDRQLPPVRVHSEDMLGGCFCEECAVGRSRPSSSASSRHRAESDMCSSSSGRHHRSRSGRGKTRKDKRDTHRCHSAHGRDGSRRTRRLIRGSGSLKTNAIRGTRSLKSSSSDNEGLCETSSMFDRSSASTWDRQGSRHRGIDALGSSSSDKDVEVSQRELFMKFFSQEVDLDDNLSPEEPSFFFGPKHESLELVPHTEHTETQDHSLRLTETSEKRSVVHKNCVLEDDKEKLAIKSYPQLPHGKKPSMLTSTCSVIMYDDDLRPHSGTRSLAVSNNVSPKRAASSNPPLKSVEIKVDSSATPVLAGDRESSSASSEVIPPPHSDPSSLLSVIDTDSAVSSAASRQASPCSDLVYTSSGSGIPQWQAQPRALDSAYQTKESSMDIFESARDIRRWKSQSLPTSKDDRRVTQRLHQAAVKLFILQQRVRKGHLSRDSAVNTISEDETGPDGDDLLLSNGLPSRHRRQLTLPEGYVWTDKECGELGIREEEEHESDLDFTVGLNPTPEILPVMVENIVEEPLECQAYDA